MKSTHDDGNAATAEFTGDLIGTARCVGLYTEGDKICWFLKGNFLHAVVIKPNVYIIWRQTCNQRGGQWLHLPTPHIPLAFSPTYTRVDDG